MPNPASLPVLAAAIALLPTAIAAQTSTANLVPSQDATLYDLPTDRSNGGGQALFVGDNSFGESRRSVLRFDVANALPAGAQVLSAELRLVTIQAASSPPVLAAMYRLEADWGEGTNVAPGPGGNPGAALPGDATWYHRFYATDLWTTPGGDFAAQPSAVADLTDGGDTVVFASQFVTDDVRQWLDGSRVNHGWIVKLADESGITNARRFHSRESNATQNRPQLVIDYVVPGTAASVGVGCPGGSGLLFEQTITGPLVGGASVPVGVAQGVAGGLAVTLAATRLAAAPLPLAPDCALLLAIEDWPVLNWWTLDGTGSAAASFPIPADPNLMGFSLALQSAGFDAAVPRGFALSNAHLVVLP